MTTDRFMHYDAGYVLGALSPEDRDAFEAHLASCPACTQAVAELAGMPGLLAQARAEGPDEPVPDTVLPALVRRIRVRRRRLGIGLAAGIAAAVIAIVLAVTTPAGESDGTPMTALGDVPIQATAAISSNDASSDAGATVRLSCQYHGGYPGEYRLVAVDKTGAADELASWRAVPNDTVRMEVRSSWRTDRFASVEVRLPNDKPVLRWTP